MKTLPLVVTLAATLFGASALHAQTTVTTRDSNGHKTTTKFTSHQTNVRERNRVNSAPVVIGPRTDGIIPRAVRSGNPLQMINPAAPAEYGSGQDVTRHEAGDPSQRPQGLRLYAVEF